MRTTLLFSTCSAIIIFDRSSSFCYSNFIPPRRFIPTKQINLYALIDASAGCFLEEETESSSFLIEVENSSQKSESSSSSSSRQEEEEALTNNNNKASESNNNKQWEEICIKTGKTKRHSTNHDYERFLAGDSVLMLSSPVLSSAQCKAVCKDARESAVRHRSARQEAGFEDEGLVRMNVSTDTKLMELLQRIFQMLDKDHKPMVEALFGGGNNSIGISNNSNSEKDTRFLLEELWKTNQLTFTSREPAVNVYTQGGEFRPHEDGQKLTILLALSSPGEDFSGGGTAFWSQDARGHRVEPPSLQLCPTACGTPILFVGHVTHAGLSVEEGERVVFVASFSPKRGGIA